MSRLLPTATYRIQLNSDFTFDDAAAIVPYLKRLGISHVYCSPYLAARPGSRHGYDIVNHADFNSELGGRDSFEIFAAALKQNGMGHILDFVPNHMGVGRGDNPWWSDVLEWGRNSPFASFFDIDWEPLKPELHGKVMLPLLGAHYGEVLEKGELQLAFDAPGGSFAIRYFDYRTPIWPRHYATILEDAVTALRTTPADEGMCDELDELHQRFTALAGPRTGQRHPSRQAIAGELKQALAGLVQRQPAIATAIDTALIGFNGSPGEPRSFVKLHRLLEGQNYRLCYWRVANDEINYRRFFDVNDLAALRVESQDVFAAIHSLVLSLVEAGKLDGLRIDHVDGLYDPYAYCRRIRQRLDAVAKRGERTPPGYLVVEKILGDEERLHDWPIDGTTGYDFMNEVMGLFIEPRGRRALSSLYRQFDRSETPYERLLYESKKLVATTMLASELQVLATELDRIAKLHWRSRDMTLSALRDGLIEVVACFPVYRTYVTGGGASPDDRRQIRSAVDAALREGAASPKVLDFIHDVLTTDLVAGERYGYTRQRVVRFAMKFQQFSSPVMAKGAEDTAFYRYQRLIALNEVGGDLERFGVAPSEFHGRNAARASRWPGAMLATMTHDAKRGEDMRARLCVLSEITAQWVPAALRWRRFNRRLKVKAAKEIVPHPVDEYLLYQTLVGSWPAAWTGNTAPPADEVETFRGRIKDFMVKAVREGKLRSSWTRPKAAYEDALGTFIDRVLDPVANAAFLANFVDLQGRVAWLGALNGLAQTVLRLTSPGVPDTYQGSELWDLRLVDPDNRRQVDYARRANLLDEVSAASADPADLLAHWPDGRIKLFVVRRLLALREALVPLFAEGTYQALAIDGELSRHLCGFSRQLNGEEIIVIVPRLLAQLSEGPDHAIAWRDTMITLPDSPRRFRDVLTGSQIDVPGKSLAAATVLQRLPFAVLRAV